MPMAVLYDLTTGRIQGVLTASSDTTMALQQPPAGQGLLPVMSALPDLEDRYVVSQGELIAKTVVSLTATPSPFVADGVSECSITVEPFVPCTLRLNQTMSEILSAEDPTLLLTADMPNFFTLTMDWHPTHWAAPLTLLAEAP